MKTFSKILAVVAALMIFAAPSADAKTFAFGVKAGANFNNLSLKDINGNTLKANSSGWEAGVMVEANVPLIGLGFDLSLMYARMNNNGDLDYANQPLFDASKNFIMIPLNLKYKISLPIVGKYLAPYIFTGPNFMFALDKHTLENMKNRTCQVAWNVGLGVEFFNHLQVGASYNFGLGKVGTPIFNGVTGINSTSAVKNNYWMVTAAYLF